MWSARMRSIAEEAFGAGCAACFIDAAAPTPPLFPEEAARLTPQTSAKRKRDLEAGRAAARGALEALGAPRVSIPKDLHGAPVWPEGWLGAITHSAGRGGAVVAARGDAAGLGVDLERLDRRLNVGTQEIICTVEERGWIEAARWRPQVIALFSAKESIFKAHFPLEAIFLDYKDATLTPTGLDASGRPTGFEARLNRRASRAHPEGTRLAIFARYLDDLVLTGVRI